jgi:hypothetical protein
VLLRQLGTSLSPCFLRFEGALRNHLGSEAVASGAVIGTVARWKFLVFVFSNPFQIIASADDQCRQLVPNSTHNVAILWRFPDISAQIFWVSRGINMFLFPVSR